MNSDDRFELWVSESCFVMTFAVCKAVIEQKRYRVGHRRTDHDEAVDDGAQRTCIAKLLLACENRRRNDFTKNKNESDRDEDCTDRVEHSIQKNRQGLVCSTFENIARAGEFLCRQCKS